MEPFDTLRENPRSLFAVLLGIALIAAGGLAVTRGRGFIGVVLILAGFLPFMYVEYRQIEGTNAG